MTSTARELTFAVVVPRAPFELVGEIAQAAAANYGQDIRFVRLRNEFDMVGMVNTGEVDLGCGTHQLVHWAHNGIGSYEANHHVNLRAIAAIDQPRWFGFGVKTATGIQRFSDIAKLKYPLRLYNYGLKDQTNIMAWTVKAVLAAHGVTLADIESWGGQIISDPHDGANAVADGTYDAIAGQVYGAYGPVGRIWNMATNRDDLRFLPIDEDVLNQFHAKYDLHRGAIPRQLLKGVFADVPSFFYRSHVMYAHRDLEENVAHSITKSLFTDQDRFLSQYVPLGYNPLKACTETGIPLHPGAEKFYRDHHFLDRD